MKQEQAQTALLIEHRFHRSKVNLNYRYPKSSHKPSHSSRDPEFHPLLAFGRVNLIDFHRRGFNKVTRKDKTRVISSSMAMRVNTQPSKSPRQLKPRKELTSLNKSKGKREPDSSLSPLKVTSRRVDLSNDSKKVKVTKSKNLRKPSPGMFRGNHYTRLLSGRRKLPHSQERLLKVMSIYSHNF